MILNLCANEFLRLTRARGTTVEVLGGRVWITEAGRERDALVGSGMQYEVAGDGLVVVGTEAGPAASSSRIAVRTPVWRWLWQRATLMVKDYAAEVRERQTIAELEALSDHRLRDLGLTRGQIESDLRRRASR